MTDVCRSCGQACSWVDARFGGHCTPRSVAGRAQRLDDVRLAGYHPGLGEVADAADFKRKVEAAKRAGKEVQKASDLPTIGERLTKTNPGPSAWERTIEQMRGA